MFSVCNHRVADRHLTGWLGVNMDGDTVYQEDCEGSDGQVLRRNRKEVLMCCTCCIAVHAWCEAV